MRVGIELNEISFTLQKKKAQVAFKEHKNTFRFSFSFFPSYMKLGKTIETQVKLSSLPSQKKRKHFMTKERSIFFQLVFFQVKV